MRRMMLVATVLVATWPVAVQAQFGGGFGGRGGRMGGGGDEMGRRPMDAPRLPGAELDGPPDSATAQGLLTLSDEQVRRYSEAYDSFMVATRPQRDSAGALTEKMHDRLDTGDRAAALFYADRLWDLGRYLKDRQDKFEDGLHHFLSGDQMKAYRRWKDDQARAAEEKNREEALRWRRASSGGGMGMGRGRGMGGERAAPEPKTVISTAPGVPSPDVGPQAVRVGRTVYVSSQLALDSSGALVGRGDLRAQAVRAFANLAAVLRTAGVAPQDVVTVRVYVVNYRPEQLTAIREAGTAYFGSNTAIATVLGVQSLARDGALIAVEATALTKGF